MLGPLVKSSGFDTLLLLMAGIAGLSLAFAAFLPQTRQAGLQAHPA
jgi:hypothetical protein